jgi:phosphoserine phosphatase RsbU/P
LNFFRNYNRAMGIAFLGVVLVLSALFAVQLQQRLQEELSLIEGHVDRHAQLIEFVLRSSADQIDALRMAADGNTLRERGAAASQLPQGENAPRQAADGKSFNTDHLKDPDSAGNLVGLGALKPRTPDFGRELHRALGLTPFLRALVFNLPGAAQTSFISAQNFQLSSPWVSSAQRPFSETIYAEPVWQMALPERNPNHEKFWAPPYFAGKSVGLLVPVAAPVYDADTFVGVVRIDTSLDYLNRVNDSFGYAQGEVFLVNENGQVLAHKSLYAQTMDMQATPTLSQALPSALSDAGFTLQSPVQQATLVQGQVLVRRSLVAAPWTLIYTVPRSTLLWQLVRERGVILLGVLLGLGVLLVVTYVITRRDFVGPAAQLVQHLSDTSQKNSAEIPQVPSSWRPWFEMVTRVFSESRKLAAVEQELSIAAEMQRTILPTHWPEHASYTLRASMLSAKQVGGDFYDHFALDNGHHGLVVADVSGKGVPAALFGMVSKTQLRSVATGAALDAGAVLRRVNNALCENNESCMFVTGMYAEFDPQSGELCMANSGHPPALLLRPNGQVDTLPSEAGIALGLAPDCDYVGQSLRLQAGEILLLYTDGVTEAMNTAHEEFGHERLVAVLQAANVQTVEQALEVVLNAVHAFAGEAEQSDDITCMALHYHPVMAGEGGA